MSDVPTIEVEELREKLNLPSPPLVIDVREKWENDLCRIPGSLLIPLGDLPQRSSELPKDRTIVLHCHHGGRSSRATAWLRQHGYDNAFNLKGGIHAWSLRIDPAVKTYQ
jgi:rhodanese-related sulfurtransferase